MLGPEYDRRQFLARIGVLGAIGGASVLFPGIATAATAPSASALTDLVKQVLAELARDTINGLAVFVVPGPDRYSAAQGTPRSEPGAMEAKTPDFLIESLDNYVPFPDQIATPVGAALATGLNDVSLDLPTGSLQLPTGDLVKLDDAVRQVLRNDETLPLSLVIALLLNTCATQVNPLSVSGPFLSPFARLSFKEKAEAFRVLEEGNAPIVAAVDGQLPEPLKGSASGILQFIAGAMLEFAAFGTYSEWSKFDAKTNFVTGTPVGWKLTNYDPGSMDGWDELRGYYQGRKEVSSR